MSYTVCVYPVREAEGGWEYLVLKRVRSHGGFWQGVTGLVEPGEKIETAAVRELFEETGLEPTRLQPIDYEHEFYSGFSFFVEHIFLAYVMPGQDPVLSREHDDWIWCPIEDAMDLLYWPGNIEALRYCHSIVTTRPS